MNKYKKLFVLAASAILLSGCNDNNNSSVNNSSSEISESSVSSESSESSISTLDWNDNTKDLLNKYCGEVLPYPTDFVNDAKAEEVLDDDTNTKYLQITYSSTKLAIPDYYKELENKSWNGIRNYSGNIAQSDSSGTTYYEFIKTSSDGKIGYDVIYFYSSLAKRTVIQCYNDMSVELDTRTSWDDSEKEMFTQTLSIVPAKVKLGSSPDVYASNEDFSYARDQYAIDLTKDNVKILEDDGWVLDETTSKINEKWVLKKDATDGAPIYASVYYFSGNYVTFSYTADVKESSSWPTEFVSSFETSTGFSIPQFESTDINKYYYCTKKGVSYIYGYTDNDSDVYMDYLSSMDDANAIYDNEYRWYTDWEENWYIKPEATLDYTNYEKIFRISFKTLDAPYDEISKSWPTDKVSTFLSNNEMDGVSVPSFPITSLSSYNSLRVNVTNYDEAYKQAYQNIKKDPDYYDIEDSSDEDEIVAKAQEIAKENTKISIKAYDPETNSSYKVFDYVNASLKNIGWAKVSSVAYDEAYEDPTGKVLLGLSKANNITTITYTHGSEKAHEAAFYFEATNVSASIGGTVKLSLVCDMIFGTITYSSNNDKFVVDNSGTVTVSSNAVKGDEATITATITTSDGKTMTATCRVSIPLDYTSETAINKVASLYNTYYSFNEGDAGYVTPTIASNECSLTFTLSGISDISDAEKLIMQNFIPTDFANTSDDEWSEETSKGVTYQTIEYIVWNDDDEGSAIQLIFKIYTQTDGSFKVVATTCLY